MIKLYAFPCWENGNKGIKETYNVYNHKSKCVGFAIKAKSREDACKKVELK